MYEALLIFKTHQNMKILFLPFMMLFMMQADAQCRIKGKINNLNNLNDSTFKVVFIRDCIRIDSTYSHTAGFYDKAVSMGMYDIELSKQNHAPVLLKHIYINRGATSINFSVKFNPALVKPVNISVANNTSTVKSASKDTVADETVIFSISSKAAEKTTSYTRSPAVTAAGASSSYRASSGKGKKSIMQKSMATSERKTSFTTSDAEMAETTEEKAYLKSEDLSGTQPATVIKAGQVTAGHWRDIDHWSEWESTNASEQVGRLQSVWGFYPKHLSMIRFAGNGKTPLSFTAVELLDKHDKVLWSTRTDQDGYAWFWHNVFGKNESPEKIRVIKNGQQKIINNAKSYINSEQKVKVNFDNTNMARLEIAFVVDATGSMGDEIKFLQVELTDVINRAKKMNPCLDIYTGSVFYKDKNDDYLTRILPLNNNPANTINFIGQQSAQGGGDFPEAVEVAMQDAVTRLNWSETDNPKIMFLLLDAPPHQDSVSKAKVRQYTKLAAEKGIRIIPIASSGIDKTTEFLLKYIAICTNGEYMYITDDSKIGNPHLKPTGGESKVSYLNDLMVQLINTYSKGDWCEEVVDTTRSQEPLPADSSSKADSTVQQQQQQVNTEIISGNNWYMKFYPNPARDILNVDFSEVAERVRITDMNGKTMFEVENTSEQHLSLDISSWNTGIYLVYAVRSNETIAGKLLVMH